MYPSGIPGIIARPVAISGGVSLRAIESGPPGGPPLVLVHGFGSSVYSFAELLPILASAGYRTIAIDLPGHGLSDKPNADTCYTTRALGDAVIEAAAALGLMRFAMIGHSMGGGIALDLAQRGVPAVERVVLINAVGLGLVRSMGPLKLISPPIVNRVVPALLTRWVIERILHVAFGTADRPLERDVDEYWAPTQFEEFVWACRACVHQVSWRRHSALTLRALRVPVLAITGGRDGLVRGSAKHAAHIAGARIVTIPEGGHLVLQECATRTADEVLAFLRETATPTR